jgi:hypothetical protein
MRKILLTALLAAGGLTASAQYLPNGDFKQWKTTCGKSDQTSFNGRLPYSPVGLKDRPGVEPEDWNGSNVNQTVFINKTESGLVTKGSENFVKLQNKFIGVGTFGSNAPAFINFATPWVYAVSDTARCDGGVYGYTAFTYKPDAIKGVFKRTQGDAPEDARIIAYFWKGTFKSPIAQSGSKGKESTRVQADVDRAIMGKSNAGTITGDGKLIASCDYAFATTKNNGWEEIVVPIDYKLTDVAPTKMNVIISSADYWTRGNIKENSILEVDDVQFVYYHALKNVTYNGKPIEVKENESQFYIPISPDETFDLNKLKYDKVGVGATVEAPVYDAAKNTVTITVKGNDFEKNDKSVTTYVFTIVKEQTNFTDGISVKLEGSGTFPISDATIQLVKELDNSYSFQLKNFSLGQGDGSLPVGTIRIKNLTIDGNHITAKQTIKIENGDDATVESWMGPDLQDVPVELDATRNGDKLVAKIFIGFFGMKIHVLFAPTVDIDGTTDVKAIEPGMKNIRFTRPLKNGWNSICLPFNMSAFDFENSTDTKLQALASYDGEVLNFEEVENSEANVPYLVYITGDNTEDGMFHGFNIGTEVFAADPQAQCRGGFCFQGNYTPSFPMRNRYGVADHGAEGQFIQKGGEKSTLPATGAYFTASGKPASVKLNLGGEVTGIDSNGVIISDSTSAPVYDLKGVRVSNGSLEGLPKGLYIQGGKKVYVK